MNLRVNELSSHTEYKYFTYSEGRKQQRVIMSSMILILADALLT